MIARSVITGSQYALIQLSRLPGDLVARLHSAAPAAGRLALFVALGSDIHIGSAVIPFSKGQEGSTVFLPFNADLLIRASVEGATSTAICTLRRWEDWKWSDAVPSRCSASFEDQTWTLQIPFSEIGTGKTINCAVYLKESAPNDGWGAFLACNDPSVPSGFGDRYIPRYLEVDRATGAHQVRSRLNGTKLCIYQLFVRLFGNINETRAPNGTIEANGVGKFSHINDGALSSLRDAGFTHIWLTGVLQQATGTDYSTIGEPADDPDLLKGLAGSPYAIKDYFDICPDYALDPRNRLVEFEALLGRIHKQGMKALIDFVPNHVARSYCSDIRPDLDFGTHGDAGVGDDRTRFFSPQNNFFYLAADANGPPLRLPTMRNGLPVSPTCRALSIGGTTAVYAPSRASSHHLGRDIVRPSLCDGLFDGELDHGKATGNNAVTWTPSLHDWYETVKLNYGFDFTKCDNSGREYPNALTPNKPLPDTWKKMDAVLAYWQSLGIDGFRCDMAHMVPAEFWKWVVHRARVRDPNVVFIGEAYNNDPAKVPCCDPVVSQLSDGRSNVMFDLLDAGFNAVYDDPTYRVIKRMYQGPAWANDIDEVRAYPFIFENSLRYSENHDEVRLSAPSQWGGHGMRIGLPVSAILYGLSRGAVMLYNGQEVGEPGSGSEGFGCDDARTSIFDYWSMPEFVKWVNGHKYDGGRLSHEQKELRAYYGRLVNLLNEPAFRDGICIPLNSLNRDNGNYGRLPGETVSGHWLYAFVRYDCVTHQTFVVAANLHATATLEAIIIRLPESALLSETTTSLAVVDRLNESALVNAQVPAAVLADSGIAIAQFPPLSACYIELKDCVCAQPLE